MNPYININKITEISYNLIIYFIIKKIHLFVKMKTKKEKWLLSIVDWFSLTFSYTYINWTMNIFGPRINTQNINRKSFYDQQKKL